MSTIISYIYYYHTRRIRREFFSKFHLYIRIGLYYCRNIIRFKQKRKKYIGIIHFSIICKLLLSLPEFELNLTINITKSNRFNYISTLPI